MEGHAEVSTLRLVDGKCCQDQQNQERQDALLKGIKTGLSALLRRGARHFTFLKSKAGSPPAGVAGEAGASEGEGRGPAGWSFAPFPTWVLHDADLRDKTSVPRLGERKEGKSYIQKTLCTGPPSEPSSLLLFHLPGLPSLSSCSHGSPRPPVPPFPPPISPTCFEGSGSSALYSLPLCCYSLPAPSRLPALYFENSFFIFCHRPVFFFFFDIFKNNWTERAIKTFYKNVNGKTKQNAEQILASSIQAWTQTQA